MSSWLCVFGLLWIISTVCQSQPHGPTLFEELSWLCAFIVLIKYNVFKIKAKTIWVRPFCKASLYLWTGFPLRLFNILICVHVSWNRLSLAVIKKWKCLPAPKLKCPFSVLVSVFSRILLLRMAIGQSDSSVSPLLSRAHCRAAGPRPAQELSYLHNMWRL